MPRPRKWKRVYCLPQSNLYGPLNRADTTDETVLMAVEEYETIRLIDLEGLTQEESAERMNVARGTIQKLYTDARRKIAESIINGSILKIEGGNYELYSESERLNGYRRRMRNRHGRNL